MICAERIRLRVKIGRFHRRAHDGALHPRGRFGVAQQTVQNGIVCSGQLEFQFLTHIYHLNGNIIIHGFRKPHKFSRKNFRSDSRQNSCALRAKNRDKSFGSAAAPAFSAHRRGRSS